MINITDDIDVVFATQNILKLLYSCYIQKLSIAIAHKKLSITLAHTKFVNCNSALQKSIIIRVYDKLSVAILLQMPFLVVAEHTKVVLN